jgi:hypothetical protein
MELRKPCMVCNDPGVVGKALLLGCIEVGREDDTSSCIP